MRICLFLWVCLWSAGIAPAYAQSSITAAADFPAFFYPGDQPKLQFILHNTSAEEKTGNLQLELFDAVKKQPVDGWFYNQLANQYFTLAPGERYAVRFPVTIPNLFIGRVAWQLTVRVDTLRQILQGAVEVLAANEAERIDADHVVAAKMWRVVLSHLTAKGKTQQKEITPFATQPVGQSIVMRVLLSLGKTHDSCRLELPFAAGLQPTGRVSLVGKGKSTIRHRLSVSDTAIVTIFYGLTPGSYQLDYYFKARYPGQFLLPASRMFFSKVWPRQMRTTSSTIEVD
jgi:hypothetical protein